MSFTINSSPQTVCDLKNHLITFIFFINLHLEIYGVLQFPQFLFPNIFLAL